jgi:hypothetical protein
MKNSFEISIQQQINVLQGMVGFFDKANGDSQARKIFTVMANARENDDWRDDLENRIRDN